MLGNFFFLLILDFWMAVYLYSFKFILITFEKRVCFCIPVLRAHFIHPVMAVPGIAVGAGGLPRREDSLDEYRFLWCLCYIQLTQELCSSMWCF